MEAPRAITARGYCYFFFFCRCFDTSVRYILYLEKKNPKSSPDYF